MGTQFIPIRSREEWLEDRKQDITASVIAALWGLHPYETMAGLYARHTGVEFPEQTESEVMQRGQDLEPVVAKRVAKLKPEWDITKANDYLRDPDLGIGGTPDYWINSKAGLGLLECKTVGSAKFRREWTDETPPFWITLQLATLMMLSNAVFGAIGVIVIGDYTYETKIYDVPRHAASEKRIRDAVKQFWADVEAGHAPEIDFTRDGPLLALLYPRETPGKTVDLRGDNEISGLLDERDHRKCRIDEDKQRVDEIDTEIKLKLTDNESALVRGWRLTYREQHRKEHMVKATSFRVLRAVREATC